MASEPTEQEFLAARETCGGFPERERVRCGECGKIIHETVPEDWEEPESAWVVFYHPGKCIEAFKLHAAAMAFGPTMLAG